MNKLLTAAALAALTSPAFATDFAPQALTLDAPRSLPVSGVSTFTVTGAQPGETVSLFFGSELTENCDQLAVLPVHIADDVVCHGHLLIVSCISLLTIHMFVAQDN